MTLETAGNIAEVAARLAQRPYTSENGAVLSPCPPHVAAREAIALATLARRMHRLDERACNEDLGCRECQGEGRILHRESTPAEGRRCRACAGTGSTTGRTIKRLEEAAEDIARRFGLVTYWQGDPRGWPLYLGPAESFDADDYHRTGFAVTPQA